ncbi:MAG: FtsX-like permease family protein [Marinifilaceae bacterium]|nr:FtsX-like permease family protein [Marinifilaceae bacterium]
MKLEYYIAKKMLSIGGEKNNISHPMIKISQISVALGICIMILSISIVTGFKSEIRNKLTGFSSHIQISNYDNNLSYETSPIDYDWVDTTELACNKNIKHIQAFSTKSGILKTDKDFQGIVLRGINSDYDWSFYSRHLTEGEIFKISEDKTSNNTVISNTLAKLLNLKLNDKIKVFFVQQPPRARVFKITGIYDTGIKEFDKLFIICDMKHIQKINNWSTNQISGYEIFLNDFNKIDETTKMLKRHTQFAESNKKVNLKTRNIKRTYTQIFGWLELIDVNVIIILVLLIFVAGFNMISGLLIIILEKTQTIGILKSIGANNWFIRKIFLYKSFLISSKGIIWGNIIGIGICAIQYYFKLIPLDSENYYVSTVPINFDILSIILINLFSILIILIILLIPTIIISRINTSEIIRID